MFFCSRNTITSDTFRIDLVRRNSPSYNGDFMRWAITGIYIDIHYRNSYLLIKNSLLIKINNTVGGTQKRSMETHGSLISTSSIDSHHRGPNVDHISG